MHLNGVEVVEEDKEQTTHTDVLLKPEKQMDPLDQDMSYEDDSYEKSYIMKEMSDWWDASQVSAMYDLSALRRYRKLSYSLKGTNQYYYYGDTDSEGKPHGKGCAMYSAAITLLKRIYALHKEDVYGY